MRLVLCGLLLCATALASACGSYHPGKIEFKFTPVPYTALPDGTPVSLDADCSVFNADEVIVMIDDDQRDAFEQWLDGVGFSVRAKLDPSDVPQRTVVPSLAGRVTYDVGVPLGSVPDAIVAIVARPGVHSAERDIYLYPPEATPFGERFFGCKAPG